MTLCTWWFIGAEIPVGTVVQTNQFQLVQGADFMGAIKWMNEFAELTNQSDWRRSQHCSHGLWSVGRIGHDAGYPECDKYRCFEQNLAMLSGSQSS
jgi:hypothetical protein